MQVNSGRVKSIEGVRGLAALVVLVHHFAVMYYPAYYWGGMERSHYNSIDIWLGQTPLSFFVNGNSGVMIFLVLTGFGTYMICGKGAGAYIKYLVLRYIKLLILAVFASVFVWLLFCTDLTFFQDIIGELRTPWFDNWNPQTYSYTSLLKENPIVSLHITILYGPWNIFYGEHLFV